MAFHLTSPPRAGTNSDMIANRKGNSGSMQTIVDGSDTTTERLWALTDANYNVVELIEITGGGLTINDLERYTYDAYGTPTVRDLYYNVRTTGTAYDWQHLFTGQRIDLETGLYHYRNRQYHPALGTFVTRDPIGYNGGINLFEYVQGRPTIATDPKGLFWPFSSGNSDGPSPGDSACCARDGADAASYLKDLIDKIRNNPKVTPKNFFDAMRPSGSDAVNGVVDALDVFSKNKHCMNWYRDTIKAIKNAAKGASSGCTDISTNVSCNSQYLT